MVSCCLSLGGQPLQEYAQAVTEHSGFPPAGGNRLRSTKDGTEYFAWLLEDIRNARESIDLEYYWVSTDSVGLRLCEALKNKAREGVHVRMLVENMVTPFVPETHYAALRDAGIEVLYVHDFQRMNLLQSLSSFWGMRDHRKIVVIDGRIAYTGGMNFCSNAIYEWRDTQVRVQGPVAADLLSSLEKEWEMAGGEAFTVVVPQEDGPVRMQVVTSAKRASMEDLYVKAIENAREYFYVQTPYFCPPEPILQALKEASERGVDVRVLLPERCDWGFMNELSRDYFEQLLAAGIGVALFGEAYDHSKTFVTDGQLTYVGTANLDKRSFHINREVGLFFYDPTVADAYTRHFLELESASNKPIPGESIPRGIHKPYRAFLHWLDPLF